MPPTLTLIEPAEVLRRWAEFVSLIANVAERSAGKFITIDIFRAIIKGDFQLWSLEIDGAVDSVGLTRLVRYPRDLGCEVIAVTGHDHKMLAQTISQIEDWARAKGCSHVMPITRPGWEKALKELGYRKAHSILEKPLK